ncbi:E3 ubiquitin/ISG15 ligase TRIM25-like [Spinachia spinachia]
MAEMDAGTFSLMNPEDELTCSICLSPFDCPVTIPCGHNFCQDCLLASWKDSYSCPQCRTHFPSRPDLKKNTVLSTVVETFTLRSSKKAAGLPAEKREAVKQDDAIRCDTCMQADATHTCLTCMASFCEEHLRPHRENPTFRLHQLSQPIGDLSERICPDHHKLMEHFCSQHGRPICSLCLQQVHKGCSFTSPEEQRNTMELGLRDKLGLLDGQIEKTETAVFQIKDQQSKLKATFDFKTKKFNEPSVPRINLGSEKVTVTQAFSALLKKHLTEILQQPVEARLLILKPELNSSFIASDKKEPPVSASASTEFRPGSEVTKPPQRKRQPRSHSPGRPLIHSTLQPVPGPVYSHVGSQPGWNPPQYVHGQPQGYYVPPLYMAGQTTKKERRPPPCSRRKYAKWI